MRKLIDFLLLSLLIFVFVYIYYGDFMGSKKHIEKAVYESSNYVQIVYYGLDAMLYPAKEPGENASVDNRKRVNIKIDKTGHIIKGPIEVFLSSRRPKETNTRKLFTVCKNDITFDLAEAYYDNDPKRFLTSREGGSCHSKYYVKYTLNKKALKLMSRIGVYNYAGSEEVDVIFRIFDENNKVLYRSPVMKKKGNWDDIEIDVKGVQEIKLEAELINRDWFVDKATPVFGSIKILTNDY